jgi:hypothetical protein
LTVADPLLWHAGGMAHRVQFPPCKGADRHARVRWEALQEQSVSVVRQNRWFPVSPRESPWERAREGRVGVSGRMSGWHHGHERLDGDPSWSPRPCLR